MLKDVERNARKVAENLDYMLDNLRYSLHAVSLQGHNSIIFVICIFKMATCTKLSVSLHKEAVDDMHVTVDDSIKVSLDISNSTFVTNCSLDDVRFSGQV